MAAPAVGDHHLHLKQLQEFIDQALGLTGTTELDPHTPANLRAQGLTS
jgi:hypothetical protein